MVIVKLIGGLGNQLFQYAIGLRLARLHQTTLKLDVNSFEQYKLHRYSLASFQISEILLRLMRWQLLQGAPKKE